MLWVAEHGKIFRGKRSRVLPDGDLKLEKEDFDALLSLLDDVEESTPDFEPIFKYSRPYGNERLTVQNHVGVIRTHSGTQIEILPKISKSMDVLAARELLVEMLKSLENSPFKEGMSADLRAYDMPLFEVLLRLFLEHTTEIVRKGIARNYVAQRDNLIFLRGKLQLSEHLRRNVVHANRFYCEFDEYEANRPINRLIKGALEIVARLTEEPTSEQMCRELMYWFHDVPATQSPSLDFQRVQNDRLVKHYQPAMPSCRLILQGLNPLTQEGQRKAISMLFPMERVFEDFVADQLSSQLLGWRVSAQVSGKALVDRHIIKKMFNLRPDLLLQKGKKKVIADTKWKLINQSDRSNRYGISQSDIYQLFAYSRKYLEDQVSREVILIYPMTDKFNLPLRPFWYRQMDEVLYVLPFDIQKKELLLPDSSVLSRAELAQAI